MRIKKTLIGLLFFPTVLLLPCSFERQLPQETDTLSFFEFTLAGPSLFSSDLRSHSTPFGMKVDVDPWNGRSQFLNEEDTVQEWLGALKISSSELQAMLKATQPGTPASAWLRRSEHPAVKVSGLLEYLDFVQDVNPALSAVTGDADENWWEREEKKKKADPAAQKILLSALRDRALAGAKQKGIPPLILAKYAFQVVRLDVIRAEPQAALDDYKALQARLPEQSLTRYRTLGYLALAYHRLKFERQAFQTYVEIFDQCVPLRGMAVHSLSKLYTREEALNMAGQIANPHRQAAALYAVSLFARGDYGAEILERVPSLVPKEPLATACLIRVIQGAEEANMVRDRVALLGYATGQGAGDYDRQRAACEKAAAIPGVRKPELWLLGGAYFALLDGKTQAAEKLYQQALDLHSTDEVIASQAHLIGTLVQVQKTKADLSPELETRLVQDLQWAASLQKQGNNGGIYHSLWLLAAQKSLASGQVPRGTLFFAAGLGLDGNSYSAFQDHFRFLLDAATDDAELAQLETFLRKGGGSSLESLASKKAALKAVQVREMRVVHAIRRDDLALAQTLLTEEPAAGTRSLEFKVEPFVARYLPKASLDLRRYVDLAKKIQDQLRTSKDLKKLQDLQMRWALMLGTQTHIEWPELRMLNQSNDELASFKSDAGIYPFGFEPLQSDFFKRSARFLKTMTDYKLRAAQILKDQVAKGPDKELGAQALVAAALIKERSTQAPDPQFLALLKKDFRGTKFYQNYKNSCEALQALDPSPKAKP